MRMGPEHVPGQVAEPSPPAGPMRVRRSGPVTVTVPRPMTRTMTVTVTGAMTGPGPRPGLPGMTGPARMAAAAQRRLWISHGIQDARNLRLQHLHNSYPGAVATYPQPGQLVMSSSLSSWRTRCRMSSRMGRTASTPRPAGSGRSQSR
jgi:hypothetical protein